MQCLFALLIGEKWNGKQIAQQTFNDYLGFHRLTFQLQHNWVANLYQNY